MEFALQSPNSLFRRFIQMRLMFHRQAPKKRTLSRNRAKPRIQEADPMKRILSIGIAALSFLVAPAYADDDHIALFKNVSGTMKVARKDAVLDATSGMNLFTSDRIISSADGSAGVVFKDGTLVTVGPSTEIHLRDYAFEPKNAKYEFSMYLAKGTAIYSSGKIGKLSPESVRVDTPTATVGVRGTRFIVTAE